MPTPAIENAGDCPLTAAEADALLSRALACDASAAPALRDCLTGPRSSDFWLHADPARDGLQARAEEALIEAEALFGRLKAVNTRVAEVGVGTTVNTPHRERLNGTMRSQQARRRGGAGARGATGGDCRGRRGCRAT